MTRHENFSHATTASPSQSESSAFHPSNSAGTQHNFSEYTMPTSRTTSPGYTAANPGYTSVNNVQQTALRSPQTYNTATNPATYNTATNPSTYNINNGNTGRNWNNGGNSSYNWNQNSQNQYYREMQLQQLYAQEALQAALYNNATTPWGYGNNTGYDYGTTWPNNQINPGFDNSYQYGTGYDNGNPGSYLANNGGGTGFDSMGNPINVNGANNWGMNTPRANLDYSSGAATYDANGNPINGGDPNSMVDASGRTLYRNPNNQGSFAGSAFGRIADPNISGVPGADYNNGQSTPIYRPVPDGSAGYPQTAQNFNDGANFAPARNPGLNPGGDGRFQGQGRRHFAPQTSAGWPDLTESSYNDGATGGTDQTAPVRAGSDRSTAAQGGANWNQYDFAVYKHLTDQAQALVGHSIHEVDPNIPVRLGCARAVSLLVNKGYGFPVTDQSIANLEQTLRKDGFTQVPIDQMQPGDVICGYRAKGDYPHGAVYLGNGKIFNNDSDSGVMQIQSIKKYNNSSFKHFVILRRPATVPAVGSDQNTAQS
jgi:hypothetical protein